MIGDRVSTDGRAKIGAGEWTRDPMRKSDCRAKGGRTRIGDPVWIDGRAPQPKVPRRTPTWGNLSVLPTYHLGSAWRLAGPVGTIGRKERRTHERRRTLRTGKIVWNKGSWSSTARCAIFSRL